MHWLLMLSHLTPSAWLHLVGDRGCAVRPGQLTGQQLPEPARGPGAGDPDLSHVEVWTQVHQREPNDAKGWEP